VSPHLGLRVLRSDHKERLGQLPGFTFDSDLTFFHGFQERTLSFGCSAINFISQQHLRKHWTRVERELIFLGVEYRKTNDISGQHITGKLNTLILQTEYFGQRLRKRSLAH